MKKNGFTLIELIGVVIVLGIIFILAVPPIINSIQNARDDISKVSKELIMNAVDIYTTNNQEIYPKTNGNVYCITLQKLADSKTIDNPFYDAVSGKEIDLNTKIEVSVINDNYEYNVNNNCQEYIQIIEYNDRSGANKPEIHDGLTPIKYENNKWVVADISKKWYNYDNKEWANAVVLNTTKTVGQEVSESEIDLWYVWIPRYKYQLFNANNGSVNEQLINVEFETGTSTTGIVTCTTQTSGSGTSSETCTNATNGNWYTHPAFTFGSEQLTGFWVGKFEVSGSYSSITIKPNVRSFRGTALGSFYTAIQNMSSIYNLISYDSHMMKNTEWGAVAYLGNSKYGQGNTEVYINNSSSFYTGRSGGNVGGSTNSVATQYSSSVSTSTDKYYDYGYYTYDGKVVNYDGSIGDYTTDRTLGTKASTTGNIYGVYDMSGGTTEFVMGNMVNSSNAFYDGNAGFTSNPDSKYYDAYTNDSSSITHARGKLGDATKETLKTFGNYAGGWNSDYASFPYSTAAWFIRGGDYYSDFVNAGVFTFNYTYGAQSSSLSTRAALVSSK